MSFIDCVVLLETYLASRDNLILEQSLDSEVAAYRRKIRLRVGQIVGLLKVQQTILMVLNELLDSIRRLSWARERSKNFWEADCTGFDDERFKRNFRINRGNFITLCTLLNSMQKLDTNMRKAISLEKRVAVALYALGSSAEYRSISNLFGIGKSTVCGIVSEFCDVVWEVLKPQYMNALPLTEKNFIAA